jgi:5-methylcytosine-specific restriction endonuclease McrA
MNESYNRSRKKDQKRYQQVAKDRQDRNVDLLREWKKSQQCLVCGEKDDVCFDLHHLDPLEKEGAVSDLVRQYGPDRLMKEVEKCVVLCANCHRKVHAGKISL